MKKFYENPEIELTMFDGEDTMITSSSAYLDDLDVDESGENVLK